MVLNIETTETDITNQIHCEFSITIIFHRKMSVAKQKKNCQKIAFNLSLGKLTLTSVLQLPLEIVEARDSELPHQKKAVQCAKQHPKRLSLCQPSKWAADILKYFYCNSPATDLWKHFLPVENTKVFLLILIQNRQFFNLLILSRKFHFPEHKFQIPDREICPKQLKFLFAACAFTTLCIFGFMPIILS